MQRAHKPLLAAMSRKALAFLMKLRMQALAYDAERRLVNERGESAKTAAEFKHRALLSRLRQLQRIGQLKPGRISAQSFQRMQNVGTISIPTPGQNGTPLQIQTDRPIVALHFFCTLTTTETTATTVVEDAVNRWFRQIRLSRGGENRLVIGDGSAGSSALQMLEPTARAWMGFVPHLVQVTDGGNTALVHTAVPVSVPTHLYGPSAVKRSALRIGTDSTWFINTIAGQLADLYGTVGDLAVTVATIEVVAEINDDLGKYPAESFDLHTNFENLSLATAGTSRRVIMSADGTQLFHAYQQRENSLRSRTILTDLELRVNGSHQVAEGSWDVYEGALEFYGRAGANAPVGLGCAMLDNEFDLGGIPVAGATGWDALMTNTAGSAAASDGLNIQSFYILPHGA